MPISLARLAARLLSRSARPSGRRPKTVLGLVALEDRVTPSGTPAWAAGAAPGAEPRVWVYDSANLPVRDFLAFEPTFTGGVRTSLADLNADGVPDIVTGAGPGGGPRVRTFDGASGAEMANFFAYDPSFTGGVWVSAGPVSATANGIATGADAGGGPDVRVFSAAGVNIRGFFAYDPASTGGVRVALGRTAGGASVYAATGAGVAPVVTGFDVATGGKTFATAAGAATDTGGVFVAGGDLRPGGVEEVVTVAGPAGQPAAVRVFAGSDGSVLNQGTLPHPAGTVGVVRWAGQRAVVVADGGGASAYSFPSVGDGPSYLGAHSVDGGGDLEVGGGGVRTQSEGSEYIERLDDEVWWAAQDPGAYATVTSVVSEAEVNGKAAFKWWYEVDNTSVDWVSPEYAPNDPPTGLAGVSITGSYHQSTPLGTPQNDWGWDNYAGSLTNGGLGDAAHWLEPSLGDNGGYVYVGDVAHFWYFTEPIPVVTGSGEFFSGQIAGGGGGKALVPGPKPTVTLTVPTEVTVNANNDNKSPWKSPGQIGIPSKRDFAVLTPTAYVDTQLRAAQVVITGGAGGTLTLSDSTADSKYEGAGGSDVSFWTDAKKSKRADTVQIPASETGSYTFDFFIEGVHESSGSKDYSYIFAHFAGGGWATYDDDNLLVTPVLMTASHTIGSPTLTFAGPGTPANGLLGLTTKSLPDNQGNRLPGIRFDVNIYGGADFPTAGSFFQNVNAATNGFNTQAKVGPGATLINPANQINMKISAAAVAAGGAFPLLDGDGNDIRYPTIPGNNPGDEYAEDSPDIIFPPHVGPRVTRVDIAVDYRMFYAVRFADDSIYSLGFCDWSVNYLATSAAANQPTLTVILPDSKVTAGGWMWRNDDPGKTIAPNANGNLFLQ